MNKTMLPSLLQHVPFLPSQEELEELAQFTFETRLKKGEVLFNRGELPNDAYGDHRQVKLAIPSPMGRRKSSPSFRGRVSDWRSCAGCPYPSPRAVGH
jgi:hypothetical protein